MGQTYDFTGIEKKWQERWREQQTDKVAVDQTKPKFYVLDMFPYPSGAGLHVGHPLGYIASDIYSRYMRLRGYNVLHPMGYDAFGLPAEQYAIQTGQHPAITTQRNVERYRAQLQMLGLSYDWSRELRTSDPEYYKWTQWVFLQLFAHYYDVKADKALPISQLEEYFSLHGSQGNTAFTHKVTHFSAEEWNAFGEREKENILQQYRLAYQDDMMVNWCEALGTVLANDEVKDGLSVRGGHPVVQKTMRQWCLRITAYAERLLQGLEQLEWTDSLKQMQRNWIGRSEGARVWFPIENEERKIEVFTTRPDTIYGVTFLVLAPEHPYVESLIKPAQSCAVLEYLDLVSRRTERERLMETKRCTGEFTGSYAIHPLTGERLPIWVADYVLGGYGTGAIMAVPAHDSRDFTFARTFKLPIRQVVAAKKGETSDPATWQEAFEAKTGFAVNSHEITDLTTPEATSQMCTLLEQKGCGVRFVNYRLRDAIFSRQRYWGEPIPIYYKDGVPHPMPLEEMPLTLPEVESFLPTTNGEPPLARAKNWTTKEGYPIETSTMPGFAGSSAYYLRFMDPHDDKALVSREAVDYWRQVDLYIGGTEHATGHLLYSRFWDKFLYDLGYVPCDEPFKHLVNQGMILGRSNFVYRVKGTNKFVSVGLKDKYDTTEIHVDVNLVHNDILDLEAYFKSTTDIDQAEFELEGGEYKCGWAIEKMSKSLFNVVNPDEIVKKYGADTLRMYEMFLGPLEQSKPWDTNGIDGVFKFLRRLWNFCTAEPLSDETPCAVSTRVIHNTIKQVTEGIETLSFNVCVSRFMIALNELVDLHCNKRAVLKPFLILLAPFAPHIASELWEQLGFDGTVLTAQWPVYNTALLEEESFECPVSFNGKMRFTLHIKRNLPAAEVEKIVLSSAEAQKYIEGKTVRKVVVVPNKIVNIVLS